MFNFDDVTKSFKALALLFVLLAALIVLTACASKPLTPRQSLYVACANIIEAMDTVRFYASIGRISRDAEESAIAAAESVSPFCGNPDRQDLFANDPFALESVENALEEIMKARAKGETI